MVPADARSRFTAPYGEEAKDVKGVKSLLSHLLETNECDGHGQLMQSSMGGVSLCVQVCAAGQRFTGGRISWSRSGRRRVRLALVQLARLAGLSPMRRAVEYAAQLPVWFAGSAVPAQRRSP
jgi:hypothetical protein